MPNHCEVIFGKSSYWPKDNDSTDGIKEIGKLGEEETWSRKNLKRRGDLQLSTIYVFKETVVRPEK